jgi:FkbM family methyltransferase
MNAFMEGRTQHECVMLLKRSRPSFKWLLNPAQLIDRSIIGGHWEPHTTWAAERLIKPGDVCLDVGANMGYYTILLSYLAGPTGLVHAFETMSEPRELIAEQLCLNGLQAQIHPFGLSNTRREQPNLLTNYSWPPDGYEQKAETVQFCTLDELGLSPIDFIKVDTDGYELHFILGAMATLKRERPSILLEVCDYTLRDTWGCNNAAYRYGAKSREMLNLLQSLGYVFLEEETFTPIDSIDGLLQKWDLLTRSINLVCQHPGRPA